MCKKNEAALHAARYKEGHVGKRHASLFGGPVSFYTWNFSGVYREVTHPPSRPPADFQGTEFQRVTSRARISHTIGSAHEQAPGLPRVLPFVFGGHVITRHRVFIKFDRISLFPRLNVTRILHEEFSSNPGDS